MSEWIRVKECFAIRSIEGDLSGYISADEADVLALKLQQAARSVRAEIEEYKWSGRHHAERQLKEKP